MTNPKIKVILRGTCSIIPYAVYDAGTGELLGYADEHFGPMTVSKSMRNLREPIELDIIEVDESAWE